MKFAGQIKIYFKINRAASIYIAGDSFLNLPLTYSISNGILIGMITYVLMNMICGKFKKLSPAMYILAALFILKYILI